MEVKADGGLDQGDSQHGPTHSPPLRDPTHSPRPTLPNELELQLCADAHEQLHEQRRTIEALVENLNEGVYKEGRLMLYDDDAQSLQRGMSALGKLRERVRKGATKLRQLDADRDQLHFNQLDEFPRQKAEFRQQRRVLNKITERLTEQLDRDAQVLSAFQELVDRMGTRLAMPTLVQEAHLAIVQADARSQSTEAPGVIPGDASMFDGARETARDLGEGIRRIGWPPWA